MNKILLKLEKEVVEHAQIIVCKYKGKCCKLAIDSWSVANLVFMDMVDKLGLKKTKYPMPCKVSWLHKGHQILVSEKSEVEFQGGIYKDKVIWDMIPMDVFHIVLQRPQKFDRKVIHDGRKNCYKF